MPYKSTSLLGEDAISNARVNRYTEGDARCLIDAGSPNDSAVLVSFVKWFAFVRGSLPSRRPGRAKKRVAIPSKRCPVRIQYPESFSRVGDLKRLVISGREWV